jgi:SAM-dependent methyltransferase
VLWLFGGAAPKLVRMSDTATANADQKVYWNEAAAQAWVALQDLLDRQLEPLGARAMDQLAPRAGERVLDIGCGTGQTTLQLAARVGAQGSVLGVDISRPMLEVARNRAAAAQLPQAEFLQADAQTRPFDAGALDAVFSRFGVMFFADPRAAFANIRRALKSGGRLTFVCWRSMAENAWMRPAVGDVFADVPPPPPPEPGAPGPFAFADPEHVRGILADAGFTDIAITPHDAKLGANGLEDAIRLSLGVGPLGALLRERPEKRDEAVAELRKGLSMRLQDGKVVQDSATWIVAAGNP